MGYVIMDSEGMQYLEKQGLDRAYQYSCNQESDEEEKNPATEELKKRINDTAYAIKFTQLSDTYKEIEQTKLIEYICKLKSINLTNHFSNPDDIWYNEKSIKLDVLFNTYMSAMESYGKLDEETGEIIPFLKMFNSHLKKHYGYVEIKKGVYIEKENTLSRMREARAKDILKAYAVSNARKNKGYELPKRVQSAVYLMSELMKLGMEKEVAKEISEDVFSGNFIEDIDICTASNKSISHNIDPLAEVMEKIMVDDEIKVDEKAFVKYFVTQTLYESNINIDFECNGLYDEEFFKALHENSGERKPYEILAEMLGLKPDTVRKRLSKARILIQQFHQRS